MSDEDPYVYPGTTTLKNLFDIRDPAELDRTERRLVGDRQEEGCPSGNFDLKHLQAIHKHLFQDIYAWAGEVRTVELAKGGSVFQPHTYVEMGMSDVHKRLVDSNFLKGLSVPEFAKEAGKIIGDVNYVHPFREGNGRTQFQYLKQLAERAGHPLDLSNFERVGWINASKAAHWGDYGPMSDEIARALGARSASRDEERGSAAARGAAVDDLAAQLRRQAAQRDGDRDRD